MKYLLLLFFIFSCSSIKKNEVYTTKYLSFYQEEAKKLEGTFLYAAPGSDTRLVNTARYKVKSLKLKIDRCFKTSCYFLSEHVLVRKGKEISITTKDSIHKFDDKYLKYDKWLAKKLLFPGLEKKDPLHKLRKLYKKWVPFVEKRKIAVGMPWVMLLNSWGYPKKQNTSMTAMGKHIQMIYGKDYVYVLNNKVTSIQSFGR